MHVVGTAGHVDHGKSTLIQALTGIHPDRLKEERAREMTIDLGFGWLDLPGGETIGIVDVPGHRDFIENMLAGVGGIDAVLFVVAADEGVMPQTREHLAILDLLEVQGGVIVISKLDLAEDPEWLELIEADVRQAVRGTVLEGAPIIRVSARTGAGLDALKTALSEILAHQPERPDLGRPRLPVDRVFTMSGFGTVVTGTLTDGRFRLGEEVEILPGGMRGRVRGLQSHNHKEQVAQPGSRTAMNISGIDLDQVRRGDVLAHPQTYQPTQRIDVYFRHLADTAGPLRHNSEVKLFMATREVVGRVRLLGTEELEPGQSGWLQIELRDALVALRGDRYILRRPSPGETLGGGEVVDPHPARRHKRFDEGALARLESYRRGTPAEVLLQALSAAGPASAREVVGRARLDAQEAAQALSELLEQGQALVLEEGRTGPDSDALLISQTQWVALTGRLEAALAAYHQSFPLRRGMPREELKSRLKLAPRLFTAALRHMAGAGRLREGGAQVALPEHSVRLNPVQEGQRQALWKRFAATPYAPPGLKECQADLGEDLAAALIDLGELVQVSADVVFRKADYEAMLAWVRQRLAEAPTLTVAEFRDQFQTTRKYALGLLEHLDGIGITARDGDLRRLRKNP